MAMKSQTIIGCLPTAVRPGTQDREDQASPRFGNPIPARPMPFTAGPAEQTDIGTLALGYRFNFLVLFHIGLVPAGILGKR